MDIFTSPAIYLWLGDPGDASAEADWILCEVDGSHTIKEKKNFDTITCSITLPELYTQRL
jgi:hypothetical protein